MACRFSSWRCSATRSASSVHVASRPSSAAAAFIISTSGGTHAGVLQDLVRPCAVRPASAS
ncbi:MAG: hypothetical protein MZW92_19610 [Comamonadaceae bacterium]|nr:hypothetical protein [Comamonadaceae bacterium]